MVEKNENNTQRSRLSILSRFRRRSREEILKEDLRQEAFLDHYSDILSAEAEVLYRIPYFMWGAHSAARKIENENRMANPITSILGVGGLTSRNIGHMEDHRYLTKNISSISEDVLRDKRYIATRGYDDFDGFLIVDDMPGNDKMVLADSFRRMLPTMPESIRGFFSYEFHDDCIKSNDEFRNLVESSRINHYVPMIKKHEWEILDPDPSKRVVPTVLYMNPNSVLQPTLQELVEKGYIRTMESYNDMTLSPWALDYKATFPAKAQEIIGNVVNEIKNNGLVKDDSRSCLEVYSKL